MVICIKLLRKPIAVVSSIMLIFFIHIMFEAVNAEGKYERKSITFVKEVLVTKSAGELSQDRISQLTSEIRRQIETEMPRFDHNELPDVFFEEFRKGSKSFLSEDLGEIDKMNVSIKEIENSMSAVSHKVLSAREFALEDKYLKEYWDLSERRKSLIEQRKSLEMKLFNKISESMTKTIGPGLIRILSDPEIQRIRAQEYVNETERHMFIVQKARELGITSEDLEKVMNSAYLYVVILTDYSQFKQAHKSFSKNKREKPTESVYCSVSGGMIWFKFVVSKDDAHMEVLKQIATYASGSGTVGLIAVGDKLEGENYAFNEAVKSFASNLKLETRKIKDFVTFVPIIESIDGNVGFQLGKREGVYLNQKFSIYDMISTGDKVKKKKVGFMYVTNVGDNVSQKGVLSYGKVIAGKAEPGMQVFEYPTMGIDMNVCFKAKQINIDRDEIPAEKVAQYSPISKGIVWLRAIDISLRYDLGRRLKTPQTFGNIGLSMGFSSLQDPENLEPDRLPTDLDLYNDIYIGILKKYYKGRLALIIEPLIQIQLLSITSAKEHFEGNSVSLASNVGVEFPIREDISIGSMMNLRAISVGETGKIPRLIFGVYANYSLPKLW